MKNRSFPERLGFAVRGWRAAWHSESSFRAQVALAIGALLILAILKPEPLWWALFSLSIGAVLAAELLNTALEKILDHLHPETHPMIAVAKDCAAGAVLVLAIASGGVLAALLWSCFGGSF